MPSLRQLFAALLLILILQPGVMGSAATSIAPEDPPAATPEDPELERAERAVRLAKAKKEKAEAEKAEAEAKLAAAQARLGLGASGAKASAVNGDVKGDLNKFIETQILAETAAREASRNLARGLIGKVQPVAGTGAKATLVIGTGMDLTGVQNYQAVYAQLLTLTQVYGGEVKAAAGVREKAQALLDHPTPCAPSLSTSAVALVPGITFASETVKAVADLINLFRTETEFKNQEVAVTEQMVATYLAGEILAISQGSIGSIYHPGLYSSARPSKESKLLPQLTALRSLKEGGQKEIELLARVLEKLKSLNCQQAGIRQQIAQLEQSKAGLEADTAGVTEFLKGIVMSVNEQTKLSVTAALLRAERLAAMLEQPGTFVLLLEVKAAGTTRIQKNIFWNARPDHTGGASITAQLFNHEDRMVGAFDERFYYDYQRPKAIRETLGFHELGSPKNDKLGRNSGNGKREASVR
jgi:hypothetical protein